MTKEQPWALCNACDQWFPTPDWFDRAKAHPTCPGCGAEPVAVLMRHVGGEPRMRIEGQCPRCDHWFDADAWFDHSAPVPCCPSCELPPGRLAYVSCTGQRVERILALEFAAS